MEISTLNCYEMEDTIYSSDWLFSLFMHPFQIAILQFWDVQHQNCELAYNL